MRSKLTTVALCVTGALVAALGVQLSGAAEVGPQAVRIMSLGWIIAIGAASLACLRWSR